MSGEYFGSLIATGEWGVYLGFFFSFIFCLYQVCYMLYMSVLIPMYTFEIKCVLFCYLAVKCVTFKIIFKTL